MVNGEVFQVHARQDGLAFEVESIAHCAVGWYPPSNKPNVSAANLGAAESGSFLA